MKLKLFLTLIVIFFLGSCSSYPVAQSTGKEDVGHLLFVSSNNLLNKKVNVIIDGKTSFFAKVVKEKRSNTKGTQYSVTTGRRKIKVLHKGHTLYEKEIFVSPQEVKQIILP